jgi:hypothetical protein
MRVPEMTISNRSSLLAVFFAVFAVLVTAVTTSASGQAILRVARDNLAAIQLGDRVFQLKAVYDALDELGKTRAYTIHRCSCAGLLATDENHHQRLLIEAASIFRSNPSRVVQPFGFSVGVPAGLIATA